MRQIVRLLAGVFLILVWPGVCHAYTPGDPEWRALFVGRSSMKTAAQIDQLLADARACNANAIVGEMRATGTTLYPSPYEPRTSGVDPSFDPLAYLVEKAHSGSPRIEVQVWLWVWNISSSPVPADPDHPYNRHPDWISLDDAGNRTNDSVGGYYRFDPGNPEAEEYTYNVIMDVVNRYDVDGINLDNIRYGGSHFGYNDVSVDRFNAAHGRTGQPVYTDVEWCNWRRDQVTNFVRRIYANAIAARPSIKITADTLARSFLPASDAQFSSTSAYSSVFQDWLSWMKEGILDMNLPMAYFQCGTSSFDGWTCFTRTHQYDRQCGMIASACVNPAECVSAQLQSIRDLTCSGAPNAGASLFAYSCLDSSYYDAIRGVWTSPVSIPDMPWKSTPTKGHIKGCVTFGGNTWVDGAAVTLSGPVSRTMTTDGTGFYAFIDLPPGSYSVTCGTPDHGTLTKTCGVSAGQVGDVDFDYPISLLTISGVQVGGETANSAMVTWNTNGASTSRVDYGPEPDCVLLTIEDTTPTTRHKVTITGLSPLTPYHFRVYSRHPDLPAAASDVFAFVTAATIPEFVVDNPNATFAGDWVTSSLSSQRYAEDYRWTSFSPLKTATFTPTIPEAGDYRVSEWHSEGSNRCTQVPYIVNYNGGSETLYINQQANGGKWNEICSKPFAAGTLGSVQISNQVIEPEGSVVIADAIRFTAIPESTPPSAPPGLRTTAVGDDFINLAWVASTDNVGVAGYRVTRDGIVVDAGPAICYGDANVAGNTRYAYSVIAYDAVGNKSGSSSTLNVCTLCSAPTMSTVTCDKPARVWQNSGPFTFAAVGGFGVGKASFCRYAWDASRTHTWTGSETPWSSGAASCAAASSADAYYLHIRGYNQDSRPGEPADLGPYYFDDTPPDAAIVTDDGGYSPSQTSVHATWSAREPESGIIGYKYAVGTTFGGTNLVDWTSTTESGARVAIPSQSLGAMIYVSVKAENGSKLWGGVGTSDGVRVAMPVASVAAAKSFPDTTVVYIANVNVSAVFSDCFYVEDLSRASGMRIEGPCPFTVGTRVDVGGILCTNAAHERSVNDSSVVLAPTGL